LKVLVVNENMCHIDNRVLHPVIPFHPTVTEVMYS